MGDVLQISNQRNINLEYNQDNILAASLGTELEKKHIFYGLKSTKDSVKNYKVVMLEDVIYTKSPIKGFPNGIIRTNKKTVGIVPSLYCVYKKKIDVNTRYIQLYFEDKSRLDYYLTPLVNIGARNNVNITDARFLERNIILPIDIDEQDEIVNFFELNNKLITFQQRKIDHLNDLKKGLLQQMFV